MLWKIYEINPESHNSVKRFLLAGKAPVVMMAIRNLYDPDVPLKVGELSIFFYKF